MVIYVTSIPDFFDTYLMKLSLSAGFVVKALNVIKVSGTEMSFAAFNSFLRLFTISLPFVISQVFNILASFC